MDLLTKYLESVAREAVMEKEIISISINSYFSIVKGFKSCDHFSQGIIYNVETKLTEMIDRMVEKFFSEYFEKMSKFLRKKQNDETNLK